MRGVFYELIQIFYAPFDAAGPPAPHPSDAFPRGDAAAPAASRSPSVREGLVRVVVWYRDPRMAEAMVDPRTFIPNVNDSGKVLTFTTTEAIKHGYCEGQANSVQEVIGKAGITNYELKEYKLTTFEKLMGFLVNPLVRGILIMLIVAGVYFELQTPGVTFPILLAISAAVLFFAPLYLDGLARHWEIIIFIIGLILIALEIFVIPGFGITGIMGIAFIVIGLTFSMIDNNVFEFGFGRAFGEVFRAFLLVIISISLSLFVSIYFSGKLITSSRIEGLALKSEQKRDEGFVSFDDKSYLIGEEGVALTVLRPSGKISMP